jgi:hypothetical protein
MEAAQERSFQDLPSRASPIETDISRVESTVERDSRTDASLPNESGRELIGQRRQDQSAIVDEKNEEREGTRKRQADFPRPSREIAQENAAEYSSVSRRNTLGSETNASHATKRSESLAVHPGTEKSSPSVRPREVLNDFLRPALNEGSFQPVRRVPESRAPVVQIRIGRIEVRAVEPPVPASNKKPIESPRSSVSLDQYLRRRSQEV